MVENKWNFGCKYLSILSIINTFLLHLQYIVDPGVLHRTHRPSELEALGYKLRNFNRTLILYFSDNFQSSFTQHKYYISNSFSLKNMGLLVFTSFGLRITMEEPPL